MTSSVVRRRAAVVVIGALSLARDLGAQSRGADASVEHAPQPVCPEGMVGVPATEFWMWDARPLRPAGPRRRVRVSAFCIDVTEVTVARYDECVRAGACSAASDGGMCNAGVADRANHPINCVLWAQARAYCRWRGGDLPTDAQWDLAATGGDTRRYPWGNAAQGQACWSVRAPRRSTCPVRSFPADRSPFGLYDVAGNVMEMALDWFHLFEDETAQTDPVGPSAGTSHVTRGGMFLGRASPYLDLRLRGGVEPSMGGAPIGFRCAQSVTVRSRGRDENP